jgi:hypothetical protein
MSIERREWSVPTDQWGPKTKAAPRLTRTGLGARLVVKGNPLSFTVDSLSECLPFLSLSGGKDRASEEARELGNFDNGSESLSWSENQAQSGTRGAPMGSRSDLNGGRPFALWGSRKTLPGVRRS